MRVKQSLFHKRNKLPKLNNDWRLSDEVFDSLHRQYHFSHEGCCDVDGLNGHADLPYFSPANTFLNADLEEAMIFLHPPHYLLLDMLNHLETMRKRNPLVKAIIVAPDFDMFTSRLKDYSLLREYPADTPGLFTSSPPEDGSMRNPVISPKFKTQIWLIDGVTDVKKPRLDVPVQSDADASAKAKTATVNRLNRVDVSDTVTSLSSADYEHKAKYIDLQPAYEFLESKGKMHCLSTLDPTAPDSILSVPMKIIADKPSIEVLIDTCSSLDFVDENYAIDNHFEVKSVPKQPITIAGGGRVVTSKMAYIPIPITDDCVKFRWVYMVRNLKVASLILGMSFLRDMNATILCGSSEIKFPDGKVLKGSSELHSRIPCATLAANKFAKFMRKCKRDPSLGEFFLCVLRQNDEMDTANIDESFQHIYDDADVKDITTELGDEMTDKIKQLFQEFPNIGKPMSSLPPDRGKFNHYINLKDENIRKQRINRLSPMEKEELIRQIKEYLEKGQIQPSNSPFAFPILFVRKKGGALRLCIDYRALNEKTVKDSYPLPHIDDLLCQLKDAKVTSHLDLMQGYHQVLMNPEDRWKTAFQGPGPGNFYEFTVMSFGLTNAPATFQRLMDNILAPVLGKFVIVFLDDICIYSRNADEHLDHLRQVFFLLSKNDLRLRIKKCIFGCTSGTNYLGFIIKDGTLSADPEKVAAVRDWPLPRTQSELRSFVQFCTYYHRFVHHFGDCSAILTDMLRKNQPSILIWSSQAKLAFMSLKQRLISAPVLVLPEIGTQAMFTVATDASSFAIAGVLLQDQGHGLQPVEYYARKLKDAERNYDAYNLEALAACACIKKWRVYVEGSAEQILVTDHDTLRHLLKEKPANLSKRQAGWVELIQPYANTLTLVYRKGSLNEADPISRRSDFCAMLLARSYWDGNVPVGKQGFPDVMGSDVACCAIRRSDMVISDNLLNEIKQSYKNDPVFRQPSGSALMRNSKFSFDSDTGLWFYLNRIYIPKGGELKRRIIYEFHDAAMAGHPSVNRTTANVLSKFFFPDIRTFIKDYVENCIICKRAKSIQQNKVATDPLPVPPHPWHTCGMDFITELPLCEGFDAILVVVDHMTRLAHFLPCNSTITAKETAELFLKEIIRLHGIPKVIVSDRDPLFTSKFWDTLWRTFGTKLNMSTARHPQTDGLSERANEFFQQLLRCYNCETNSEWVSQLPVLEFCYNTQKNESIRDSPFSSAYGYDPVKPIDVAIPISPYSVSAEATDRVQLLKDTHAVVQELLLLSKDRMAHSDTPVMEFKPGDLVYLITKGLVIKQQRNHKLRDRQLGPFKVIRKIGNRSYAIALTKGYKLHNVFHVDKLRPAYSSQPLRQGLTVTDEISENVEDDNEFEVSEITDAKIDKFPKKRGPQLLFWTVWKTEEPSWEPYHNVYETSALDDFFATQRWKQFGSSPEYITWAAKYPKRKPQQHL